MSFYFKESYLRPNKRSIIFRCTANAQNVAYLGTAISSEFDPKAYPERVIDGNTNGIPTALSTNVNSPDKYGYAWCKVSFK